MVKIEIPYGNTHLLWEGELNSWEILAQHGSNSANSFEYQFHLIEKAMANPIGSPSLNILAQGKKSAVIVISDHTRPVPSKLILPPMLSTLRTASPEIDITLLVATGCHRGTTAEELRQKLGREIAENEHIVIHDCDSSANMVNLGTLPSGVDCRINRIAVETQLLLAEGFIEPHFFAGYSGGRKSVLPGISSRSTVMANHCARLIDDAHSRTGILDGNLIHQDMTAAVRMAHLSYIVNVVLGNNKDVVHAVAGDPVAAHLSGCQWLESRCMVSPKKKGDIVITSNGGAPLDQNIYQSVKSMSSAEAAASPCGTLIICCQCADGIGSDNLYSAMRNCSSPSELLKSIRRVPPEITTPDQWQYQILCRILENHRVIMVTQPHLRTAVEHMKMEYSCSLDEAIEKAHPAGKHVVIIPDGISVAVK